MVNKLAIWLIGALWAAVLSLAAVLYQHSEREASRLDQALNELDQQVRELEKTTSASNEFRDDTRRRLDRIELKLDDTRRLVR